MTTHTRLPGLELSVILPSHSSAGITDVYHVWLCVSSEDSRFVLVRSALCPLNHLPRVCAITALPPSVSATLCYVVTSLRLPGVFGCPLSAFSTKAHCFCLACCYFREDVHFIIN